MNRFERTTSREFVHYNEAFERLRTGDVILFRGRSLVSPLISGYTDSEYTHAGIAEIRSDADCCLLHQFREFKGGVTTNLWHDVQKYSGRIDVFRPSPRVEQVVYNKELSISEIVEIRFEPKLIARYMSRLTGENYGWGRVFLIWLRKLPFVRFVTSKSTIRSEHADRLECPVCSTAVAWVFAKSGYILTNKNPNWVAPSDLAESPRLNYLFTLTK